MEQFVNKVQIMLQREKRLVETRSGQLLTRAFFVRVDDGDRVQEVIHCGGGLAIGE